MSYRKPFVSVIVVNHNGKELLKECFDSLANINYPKNRWEVLMVDNISKDSSVRYVKRHYPWVNVLRNRYNNYCKANNMGIKKSKGDYVAVLNNDTKVEKEWLVELVKVMASNTKIGAVGSKILLCDGRIQSRGHIEFPYYYWGDNGFLEEDLEKYNEVKAVPSISSCSALYRRKALDEVGLFDEDFGMYMEDIDISFRLKQKKWKIFYAPGSRVYHKLHGSCQDPEERTFYIEKNRLLFVAKYFPQQLPNIIAGYGEIGRIKLRYFHILLVELFNKLVKHHGNDKARHIFANLYNALKKTDAYKEHCLRVESEKSRSELEEKYKDYDKKIKLYEETITAQNSKLAELNTQASVYKEQTDYSTSQAQNLYSEVRTRDKHIQSQQEKLTTQANELANLNIQVAVYAEQVSHLQEQIEYLSGKIADGNNQILCLERKIKSSSEQLKTQGEIIMSKEESIKELTEGIRSYKRLAEELKAEIQKREKQIEEIRQTVAIKESELSNLKAVIEAQKNQLTNLSNELSRAGQYIKDQNLALTRKDDEIASIYNSETYRMLVRPIIWPLMSFVKRAAGPFEFLRNKNFAVYQRLKNLTIVRKIGKREKKVTTAIAQLYAKNIKAEYMKKNEYFIKLINKGVRESKITLLVEIWPFGSMQHLQQYYARLSAELSISPGSAILSKLAYDWAEGLEFFANNRVHKVEYRRGRMGGAGLYIMKAIIYDDKEGCIDTINILQRLEQ